MRSESGEMEAQAMDVEQVQSETTQTEVDKGTESGYIPKFTTTLDQVGEFDTLLDFAKGMQQVEEMKKESERGGPMAAPILSSLLEESFEPSPDPAAAEEDDLGIKDILDSLGSTEEEEKNSDALIKVKSSVSKARLGDRGVPPESADRMIDTVGNLQWAQMRAKETGKLQHTYESLLQEREDKQDEWRNMIEERDECREHRDTSTKRFHVAIQNMAKLMRTTDDDNPNTGIKKVKEQFGISKRFGENMQLLQKNYLKQKSKVKKRADELYALQTKIRELQDKQVKTADKTTDNVRLAIASLKNLQKVYGFEALPGEVQTFLDDDTEGDLFNQLGFTPKDLTEEIAKQKSTDESKK